MIQVHISVLTFHSPAYFLNATFGMQVAKWNIAFRNLDWTILRIKEVKGSSRAPKIAIKSLSGALCQLIDKHLYFSI